jgi:hypothetical protein
MTWQETTKLTPSAGTDLKQNEENRDLGCQRDFFLNPDKSTGIGHL